MSLLLAAAAALALPTLLAIRIDEMGGRRALTILTSDPMRALEIRREGDHLIVPLPASIPPGFVAPGAQPPIQDIGFERGPFGLNLRLRLPRGVPYSLRQDGAVARIVFGPEAAAAAASQPRATDLFKTLFRATPDPAVTTDAPLDGSSSGGSAADEATTRGFGLGPLRLHPSLTVNYWEGVSAVGETAKPQRHRYLEVQPGLVGNLSLFEGRLKLGYEPRLRGFSTVPAVNQWSHRAQAALDLPVGALRLRAAHSLATGILETTEVDPGREYFFHLGRFTHHDTAASGTFEPGGRIDLEVGGSLSSVRIDDQAAFFDHDTQNIHAGVGYALREDLKMALVYGFERVPLPANRPEAASDAHILEARISGELMPLMRTEASFGYRRQNNPNAAEGGRHYGGTVLGARLLKELTPSITLGLSAGRSTPPSAFEGNGFYVTTSYQAELTVSLPFAFTLRGGGGLQQNSYRTPAAALGHPRQDRINGWTFGLGRSLIRWAYVRADYRAERRNSNLDEFDSEAHGLVLQFGISLQASPRS